MYTIVLITTKGCIGCNVMRSAIREAINTSNLDISFTVKDIKELSGAYKATHKLRDFPTTQFFVDNRKVRQEIGSRPSIVVKHWIKLDFK